MKKQFGQNFLINNSIKQIIIKSLSINNQTIIYEVGPGNGSLTKEILKKNPRKLVCIEIDKSLSKELNPLFNNNKHKVIYEDALRFEETKIFKNNTIIFGNLPYNISIKLLIKWIHQYSNNKWYKEMFLMFQKEVGDRIMAKENTKKYGRISLLCSVFFKIDKIVDINKKNFFPIPKVDSVFLKFSPLEQPKICNHDLNKLELLSKVIFSNRRKKLKNKLIKLFDSNDIEKYKIYNYFDLRAENLDRDTFFNLTKIMK